MLPRPSPPASPARRVRHFAEQESPGTNRQEPLLLTEHGRTHPQAGSGAGGLHAPAPPGELLPIGCGDQEHHRGAEDPLSLLVDLTQQRLRVLQGPFPSTPQQRAPALRQPALILGRAGVERPEQLQGGPPGPGGRRETPPAGPRAVAATRSRRGAGSLRWPERGPRHPRGRCPGAGTPGPAGGQQVSDRHVL